MITFTCLNCGKFESALPENLHSNYHFCNFCQMPIECLFCHGRKLYQLKGSRGILHHEYLKGLMKTHEEWEHQSVELVE